MFLTYTEFLAFFPEFAVLTQPQIDAGILNAEIETNTYPGESNEQRRKLMVGLYVAHLLDNLRLTASGQPSGGVIKSISSNNDEIEYATDVVESFSLDSTSYGKRLDRMLNSYSIGFLF